MLVSSCTRQQYELALAKWDTAAGTLPDRRSAERFRQTARRRLSRIRQFLPDQARPRLLDVGCSSGSLLAVATEMGFSAVGVEAAPAPAASARDAGFEVITGTLQDAGFAAESFDVITLIELIEHVIDPLGLLHACHRLLCPGGVVLINTPNAESWSARVLGGQWEGFSLTTLGGHVCFYSPGTVRVLARRTGFGVARIATRHVRLVEADKLARLPYRVRRLISEVLAMPARWLDAGHDLQAILQRGQ